MQVYFWGSRGSLPASITAGMVETKIFKALQAARSLNLETDDAIKTFIERELPFAVRASYGGNTSCVEIRGGKEHILCDAGTGLRDFGNYYLKSGKAAGFDNASNVFHIFISHIHWDHIQGFPFFSPAYLPGNIIHIYGCHDELEKAFIGQQHNQYFPVPLQGMQADINFHVLEPAQAYDIAGIKVTGIKQNHPGDSYGFCFCGDGKKIIYSTDSEHKHNDTDNENYEFIEFFKNADLLIFDAQYSFLDSVGSKENWGHSSNILGVELALLSGVRHLCLFHSEHTFDDESLDNFLDDTRKYLRAMDSSSDLKINLAYDGLEIKL